MDFKAVSKGFIKIDLSQMLTFKNEHVIGADYSGKKLSSFTSINSKFENCKFENMKVEDMSLGEGVNPSEYINCSFDNSIFRNLSPGCGRFINCSFRNINIKEMFSFSGEFINCVFSGKMRKTVFNGKVLKDSESRLGRVTNQFYGNDFSGLDMTDVDFRTGVDLSQQILPQGDNYLYLEEPQPILDQAKIKITDWNNSELKREAEILIKIEEDKIADGQKQLFFIKKDMNPELFSLLKELAIKAGMAG